MTSKQRQHLMRNHCQIKAAASATFRGLLQNGKQRVYLFAISERTVITLR